MLVKILLLNVNPIAIGSIKHNFFWKRHMLCACVAFEDRDTFKS